MADNSDNLDIPFISHFEEVGAVTEEMTIPIDLPFLPIHDPEDTGIPFISHFEEVKDQEDQQAKDWEQS